MKKAKKTGKRDIINYLVGLQKKDYKTKNIDDEGVYSLTHNPLTIGNELIKIV